MRRSLIAATISAATLVLTTALAAADEVPIPPDTRPAPTAPPDSAPVPVPDPVPDPAPSPDAGTVTATDEVTLSTDATDSGTPDETETPQDDELSDRAIGAEIGVTGGGRVTPGGMRIAGHFIYQLSEQDWFDGAAAFTYGGSEARCFRDRMDEFLCDHGFASGGSFEVSANVRRVFAPSGNFRPFARAGIGVALVRYSGDDVSGLAFPFHAGGGIRARVMPGVAVVVQADVQLGFGLFGHGLGLEPQLGMTIGAGAEFRLR